MLDDPNFDRVVVLVVEHSAEGALGLVLNQPSEIPVRDALPEWGDMASEPPVVHRGGPVEPASGWCLGRIRGPVPHEGFVPLLGDLGLVDLGGDPQRYVGVLASARFYAGYSGWGAGQLEGELALDAWIVVDAAPGDPFHPDPAALWHDILARQRGRLSDLANFPPHPSAN